MLEHATEKRGATERRIKMPGGEVRYSTMDPKDIARILRANSTLGKREAKLKAAADGK